MASQDAHFDAYTWRARVLPVFLVLLPVAILVALWLPQFNFIARISGVLAAPFGIAMLISQIGRDKGSNKQPALWASWGGAPTIQLLRHRNKELNPVIRESNHRKLVLLFPDLKMPTLEEEQRNPANADSIYQAATRYLIGRTRDRKQFPLVFKENVNYGFRRNLWALKPVGITLALAGIAGSGLRLWLFLGTPDFRSSETIVSALLSAILLLFWTSWATPAWVRIAAEAYAERLFESCDQLLQKLDSSGTTV